jgi:hypothetical protein
MTPFGPQLIGETEKTLGAILRGLLDDTGLTEPQWVTLRIAQQNEAGTDLATQVAGRAHFPDAARLVATLTERGLLAEDTLTVAGRDLVTAVLARSAAITGPIWDGMPAQDVAATERVLNTLIARGREVLSAGR